MGHGVVAGWASATSLADLTKAYETVILVLLWVEAVHWECPLAIMRMIMVIYSLPRAVSLADSLSYKVETVTAIIAGSVFANACLRILLTRGLDDIVARWPRAVLRLFVDDIALQIVGPSSGLRRISPRSWTTCCFDSRADCGSLCPEAGRGSLGARPRYWPRQIAGVAP